MMLDAEVSRAVAQYGNSDGGHCGYIDALI